MVYPSPYVLGENAMKQTLDRLIPKRRTFEKHQTIMSKGLKEESQLCLLLDGTAYLILDNENGERQLLDFYTKGQFFSYGLFPEVSSGNCQIIAKYKCEVAYFPLPTTLESQKDRGLFQSSLPQDIFMPMISAANEHINMLQQKSVRSRLLSFIRYQSMVQGTNEIHIPIPYMDLADYLSIDRSSVIRELAKMQDEGLVKKNGRILVLQEGGR